jgi:guanylate kinase
MTSSSKAVIVSAPSGSGKSTLVSYLLEKISVLQFSVSATSRKPRANETDQKDYYFLSEREFQRRLENDEFVEWEEVYDGIFYGTLKSEVEKIWTLGKSVIFDVDVQGGINLKKYFGDAGLSIFIMVSDMKELEQRLMKRDTESEENINMRLAKAEREVLLKQDFDHIILNDDLNKAKQALFDIVNAFLKS